MVGANAGIEVGLTLFEPDRSWAPPVLLMFHVTAAKVIAAIDTTALQIQGRRMLEAAVSVRARRLVFLRTIVGIPTLTRCANRLNKSVTTGFPQCQGVQRDS